MTAWKPSASIADLKKRADLIRTIRTFFEERGYLEVETPIMAKFGVTDRYLSNIRATFRSDTYYLQTSPEYHMKRLLAAGSGPIFQLARVFRDDELGRFHNPEFTLLEWYQLGIDHHELMREVDALLQVMLGCGPLVKISYQALFLKYCDCDPFQASIAMLKKTVARFELQGVLAEEETDPDPYLFLLMSHVIEPQLAKASTPMAVFDFPKSQASLARVEGAVALRFEVYYGGVELMNGFYELTDATMQQVRFEADVQWAKAHGKEMSAPDTYLLAALQHGLPVCSGVALGVDRLMALALQTMSIAATMAFDISRA